MTTLTDHAKEKKYMTLSLDTALPHDKEDSTVLLHYIPYHHLYSWILNEEITSYNTSQVNNDKKDFQHVDLIFKTSQLKLLHWQI